jgi:hypothetical protein
MPESPKDTEHQRGPESVEATLQPGKGKPAPAHLLEKSDDDHRRQEGEDNSPHICVRTAPEHRRARGNDEGRRNAGL